MAIYLILLNAFLDFPSIVYVSQGSLKRSVTGHFCNPAMVIFLSE